MSFSARPLESITPSALCCMSPYTLKMPFQVFFIFCLRWRRYEIALHKKMQCGVEFIRILRNTVFVVLFCSEILMVIPKTNSRQQDLAAFFPSKMSPLTLQLKKPVFAEGLRHALKIHYVCTFTGNHTNHFNICRRDSMLLRGA